MVVGTICRLNVVSSRTSPFLTFLSMLSHLGRHFIRKCHPMTCWPTMTCVLPRHDLILARNDGILRQKWLISQHRPAIFSHFWTKFLNIISAKNVVGNVMLATCCRKCCVVSSRPKMSSGMSSSTTFVIRQHVVSSRWHSRQQVHHWFKWPLLFGSTWSCTRTSWFDLTPNLNLYLY